jgi:hypothetical protein
MTCDGNDLFFFDAAGDPALRVNTADGSTTTLSEGSGASAAVFEDGLIFELRNSQSPVESLGYLTALDPNTGLESSSRLFIPGTSASELFLLAPDAPGASGSPGLWVVGGNEALLLHITFG